MPQLDLEMSAPDFTVMDAAVRVAGVHPCCFEQGGLSAKEFAAVAGAVKKLAVAVATGALPGYIGRGAQS